MSQDNKTTNNRTDYEQKHAGLIQELETIGRQTAVSEIPTDFKSELRQSLLKSGLRPGWGRQLLAGLNASARTAVALGLLGFIVLASWLVFSQRPVVGSANMGRVDVPDRSQVLVYDQLRLELPMWVDLDSGYSELTVESWQSLNGEFFRGQAIDSRDKYRVFVQGDGEFLWRGTYDEAVNKMEFVTLQYFDVFHTLAQAEGRTGASTQPPFYDGLGWDGLVQNVVRLQWDCTGSGCVEQYLVEPPLGVASRSGVYDPYAWGVSFLGTETLDNGRTLNLYHIGYDPEQTGEANEFYRQVKLDADNHMVVEVADYDGDTLLRRLTRVEHSLVNTAELPQNQFRQLPRDMSLSYILPRGLISGAGEAGLPVYDEPGGSQIGTLANGTEVFLHALIDNQPPRTVDGVTWELVGVSNETRGWVQQQFVQWPITHDGQVVTLDKSNLPGALSDEAHLSVLLATQNEIERSLPTATADERALMEQMLPEITREIERLQQKLGAADDNPPADESIEQIIFNDSLQLIDYRLESDVTDSRLTLTWRVLRSPDFDASLFVHLFDEHRNIVALRDFALLFEGRPTGQWQSGETVVTSHPLALPDELPRMNTLLVIGLARDGQRLPVTGNDVELTGGDTAVHLLNATLGRGQTAVAHDADDLEFTDQLRLSGYALTDAAPGEGLTATLYWYAIGPLANDLTPFVQLIHPQTGALIAQHDGTASLPTTTGQPGLPILDAHTLFIPPETAVGEYELWVGVYESDSRQQQGYQQLTTINVEREANRVWLISATQAARASVDAPLTISVTVGYEFEASAAEEVTLQLLAAHPDWKTASDDRIPIDSLTEMTAVSPTENQITFTVTPNPNLIREITGTEHPVLVAQLSTVVDHDDERGRELVLLDVETFSAFPLDFANLEAVDYLPPAND